MSDLNKWMDALTDDAAEKIDLDELMIPDHIVMVNTSEIVDTLKGMIIGVEFLRATHGADPAQYLYRLGLMVGMVSVATALGVYDDERGHEIIDTIMSVEENPQEDEEDAENGTVEEE